MPISEACIDLALDTDEMALLPDNNVGLGDDAVGLRRNADVDLIAVDLGR